MKNIIEIIQKHSLVVRCLPYEVVLYRDYQEGDGLKKYVDSKGNTIEAKREVIIQNFDLEHFQITKPQKWDTDSPEMRYARWRKNFPNGRKLLKETRIVEKGGWWIVKGAKHTDSSITFSLKNDFCAPTLSEAIDLYLKSIE